MAGGIRITSWPNCEPWHKSDTTAAGTDLKRCRNRLQFYENLWRQYRTCRRNKRNTLDQLRFELDDEAQLLTLAAGTAGPRLSARPGFTCGCGRHTFAAPPGPVTPLPRSPELPPFTVPS